jgi:hypothetical protein
VKSSIPGCGWICGTTRQCDLGTERHSGTVAEVALWPGRRLGNIFDRQRVPVCCRTSSSNPCARGKLPILLAMFVVIERISTVKLISPAYLENLYFPVRNDQIRSSLRILSAS